MFDANWGRDFNTMESPACWSIGTTQPEPPRSKRILTLEEQLRRLHAQRCAAHPDRGGSHEEFIRINAKYEALRRKLGDLVH